ncbi:hypothetical protein E2C01_075741 [Portunus trituberculatus]|uniref:Uncharacterized protein n=1 Tax=Portunus trituberculatus TaxID=210409 RepID=A0A5B7I9D7_PORTR|nr:hypothetical protein [Portunus trituberculatus]
MQPQPATLSSGQQACCPTQPRSTEQQTSYSREGTTPRPMTSEYLEKPSKHVALYPVPEPRASASTSAEDY